MSWHISNSNSVINIVFSIFWKEISIFVSIQFSHKSFDSYILYLLYWLREFFSNWTLQNITLVLKKEQKSEILILLIYKFGIIKYSFIK